MTRRTSSGSNGFPNVGAALRLRNSTLSERREAVFGGVDPVRVLGEDLGQYRRDLGLVVDDQDRRARRAVGGAHAPVESSRRPTWLSISSSARGFTRTASAPASRSSGAAAG